MDTLYDIRLTAFFPRNLGKPAPERILMKQEMMGCSGIGWTICKWFAPCFRQITMPVPYQSPLSIYWPYALPDFRRLKEGRKECPSCHWANSVKALKAAWRLCCWGLRCGCVPCMHAGCSVLAACYKLLLVTTFGSCLCVIWAVRNGWSISRLDIKPGCGFSFCLVLCCHRWSICQDAFYLHRTYGQWCGIRATITVAN